MNKLVLAGLTHPGTFELEPGFNTLGRNPTTTEVDRLKNFATQHGLENTARAILNSNEFLFVD
jgi:hypothetical protein